MARVKLPEDVAARYDLVNWKGPGKQDFGRYGTIDIERLTPARASVLVARKFPHLREKPKQAPPKEDKGKK